MATDIDPDKVASGIQNAKEQHLDLMTRKILLGDKTVLKVKEGFEEEKDEYNYEGEEIKEVADNLADLKRRHDQATAIVKDKKKTIEKLQHEEKMLMSQEEQAELENSSYQAKQGDLERTIGQTKLELAKEQINKKCYMQMIERMKNELLQIKISTNKLEEGLKKRYNLLETEKLEHNKVQVEMFRAKFGLEQMTKNVDEDYKKNQMKLELLSKQVNDKTEAVARRIQRLQHRENLKEAARSDQTDQSERKTREQVLVHKFWNAFLRRKMEREMQSNGEISEAFEKIRASTDIVDLQEVVKKFLTRENTYSQLLSAVNEAEQRKEELKKEHEKLVDELQTKRIEVDGLMAKDVNEEVEALKKDIATSSKEEQMLLEKYQRCSIVYDQLRSWVLKIYKVMLAVIERGDTTTEEMQKLRCIDLGSVEDLFANICGTIENLIGKYGHIPGKVITVKELAGQDDFYKDQGYEEKNIRVRPKSKKSVRADSSFTQSQGPGAYESNAGTTLPKVEDDEQREINSEFKEERKKRRNEISKKMNDQKVKKKDERKTVAYHKTRSPTEQISLLALEAVKATPAEPKRPESKNVPTNTSPEKTSPQKFKVKY